MPDIGNVLLSVVCAPAAQPVQPVLHTEEPDKFDVKDVAPPPDLCAKVLNIIPLDGMPLPGSEAFCHIVKSLGESLEQTGQDIISWLSMLKPGELTASVLKISVTAKNPPSFAVWIVNMWNWLADQFGKSIDYWLQPIGKILHANLEVYKCLAGKTYVGAAIGVWGLKMLLAVVEDITLKVEVGIGVDVNIKVDFDMIKTYLDQLERYYTPIEAPSAQEATNAWLNDVIDVHQRDCIWRLNGRHPETFDAFAIAEREKVDWREALQYVKRMGGNEQDERDALRVRGFVSPIDSDVAREMYWELPGVADHLHWLQRNVFDTDYVKDYQLLEGFEERFWATFGDDLTALGMRKRYAEYHYAAHWVMPSPEQLRQFLYRTDEIKQATGREFNINDMERILVENDYNILARQWFVATAYQVPAISYIKEWYRQGIIDRKELESYHRRLGYSFEDASLFADIDDIQKARMRTSQSRGWTTGAATTAWFAGQMDEAEHTQHFADLGYTMYEAGTARDVVAKTYNVSIVKRAKSRVLSQIVSTLATAIDIGAISASDAAYRMVAAGWPKSEADAFAALQSALGGTRRIKQGITYLRRMVLTGVIGFPTAQLELTRMGIVPDAMQSYMALWQLQLTPGRKRRSATDIVNDVANGHMTTVQAVVRLSNLGYDNADTMLYLADAQSKLIKTQTAIAAAAQKKGLAKAKAQAAVAKAAQKQHDDTVKAMKREIPVAKLQKWAKLGIIGLDFFMQRMSLYGYTATDAEWYYEEACKGKGAACVAETPEPTNPIADSSGGPGDAGGSGKAT